MGIGEMRFTNGPTTGSKIWRFFMLFYVCIEKKPFYCLYVLCIKCILYVCIKKPFIIENLKERKEPKVTTTS